MIRIGEAQIVSHPALDNDSKGFAAALAEEGFVEGKNVTIERSNAQGEQPNCAIIARKFEDDKVDLVHAISTPNAQAQVKISKKIPIVFSSVTDPVENGHRPEDGGDGNERHRRERPLAHRAPVQDVPGYRALGEEVVGPSTTPG